MNLSRVTVAVGSYGVNCSVLTVGGGTWIVDPGDEPARIVDALKGAVPTAILLTHAHFDHVGAVTALQERFPGLPLYVHPEDVRYLGHPMNRCPPDYPGIPVPRDIRDCRTLEGVTVIETPGHTPGGVCYHFPDARLVLTGDTLFAGSVGRTDFPGGDMARMIESLKRLIELPEATTVVPGHGDETTIATEKRRNPFLRF